MKGDEISEIQQYADLSYGHIVHWASTRNQAESKYYTVLAAAAISELPSHSATLIDSEGTFIMSRCYHYTPPAPEPEPEAEPTSEPDPEPEPEPEPEIDDPDEQEPVDETPVEYYDPNAGVD